MNSIDDYMYSPQDIQLAREIAERLHDDGSFKQFLRYAQKYSHRVIRERLNKVFSYPDHKIRTTRAAYFVYLIEQLEYSRKEGDWGTLAEADFTETNEDARR